MGVRWARSWHAAPGQRRGDNRKAAAENCLSTTRERTRVAAGASCSRVARARPWHLLVAAAPAKVSPARDILSATQCVARTGQRVLEARPWAWGASPPLMCWRMRDLAEQGPRDGRHANARARGRGRGGDRRGSTAWAWKEERRAASVQITIIISLRLLLSRRRLLPRLKHRPWSPSPSEPSSFPAPDAAALPFSRPLPTMSSKRGRKRNDNLPPNRARDVQRAFRARRAAHLEVRITLSSIAHLR